jgi:Zn-dependent metalloprotease
LTSPISSQSAILKVVADAKPSTLSDAANKLLNYTGPTSELVVYPRGVFTQKDRWAYRVVVRPDFVNMYEYFVDAQTGEIFHKDNISCTTTTTLTDLNGNSQTLNTYQASNNNYYMIDATRAMYNTASTMPDQPQGALWTVDANNSDASNIQVQQITSSDDVNWSNPSSNSQQNATIASAAANGATAYTYYLNVHGRNSIDGNGGTIISVINVEENGQGMDNAFWNGQLMAYGNGQTYFKPLAGGVDVAGHEMTHGVIQATANLQYENQSGALNESMADVFGTQIGNTNFTIGATVVNGTGTFPTGILRDLSNPHNGQTTPGAPGWQPAVLSEYVNGTDDNGGVHTNSGITNHAFYYFATWVGRSTADSIYYRALTKYLVTGSQFLDARVAVVNAASDLYGASSSVVHYAGLAFDSVGIIGTVPTVPLDTAAVNGPDWIIYQNTDNTNANTLYLMPASNPSGAVALTNIPALYRVSVTDDGSNAYFVDTNHNVYNIAINTTGASTVTQVSGLNTGDWDFVSVSRDGSKLALISKFQDTSIFVYDIPMNSSVQFHLYDPTFSAGISTNGPIYAGTADWDPTGQYVIYDEYNQLTSSDGTDISYWDIGLMQVWDNSVNTWKDSGLVSKLVNNLPDGVNVANPVYSKNHANIVAFDYLDSTGAFTAKGADLNTGNSGIILSGNSVPNVPSFSGEDDRNYSAQYN